MPTVSKNWGIKLLYLFLISISFLFLFLTLQNTHSKIGKPFPGYLTFKNGVIGVFYLPGWEGLKEGFSPKTRFPGSRPAWEKEQTFSEKDYILVVLIPVLTGILLVLLGVGLCHYLSPEVWRFPLLLFHFLLGNFLILSPEAQLTYRLYFFQMACFVFLPAPMVHLALSFPPREGIRSFLNILPYSLSALTLIPFLYFFLRDPAHWVRLEYIVFFYLVGAYFFWVLRLVFTLREPSPEFNRIIARYLLLGQVTGLLVPLAVAIAILVGGIPFPLNLAVPLTLLFPSSLFVGVLLARLRQSQVQLFQSKKRAALGNLLAGLAHELNNPITFLYSNIEPLREFLGHIKEVLPSPDEKTTAMIQDLDLLVDNMEEGAERVRSIIDNFRYFSYPDRPRLEKIDLHRVLNQSLDLLTPKWKNRIKIVRNYGELPMIQGAPGEIGQVFVNILANACDAIYREGTIEIMTGLKGSKIEVRIRDSGTGISNQFISKIFDPFYTSKGQGEGTGLGLSIAIQIIESHKGTIKVRSEPGKGTEFIVTLPVNLG